MIKCLMKISDVNLAFKNIKIRGIDKENNRIPFKFKNVFTYNLLSGCISL